MFQSRLFLSLIHRIDACQFQHQLRSLYLPHFSAITSIPTPSSHSSVPRRQYNWRAEQEVRSHRPSLVQWRDLEHGEKRFPLLQREGSRAHFITPYFSPSSNPPPPPKPHSNHHSNSSASSHQHPSNHTFSSSKSSSNVHSHTSSSSSHSSSSSSSSTSASESSLPSSTPPPLNVLLIKKPGKEEIKRVANDIASLLLKRGLHVFCEPNDAEELPTCSPIALWAHSSSTRYAASLGDVIDLVITVGGDGTVLHANSLFPEQCPPLVAVAMGSLGFLTEVPVGKVQETLEALLAGRFTLIDRHRLRCEIHYANADARFPAVVTAMNEVSLVRGSPDTMLVCLDVSVNDHKVCNYTGDGVIVSTSTGSTAYSLSCGGPMLHPRLDCLLLTPICPRSLSFRPVVLPRSVTVELGLSSGHRNPREIVASFDGRSSRLISSRDAVRISISPHPVPTFTTSPMHGWLEATKELLKWNTGPNSLHQ